MKNFIDRANFATFTARVSLVHLFVLYLQLITICIPTITYLLTKRCLAIGVIFKNLDQEQEHIREYICDKIVPFYYLNVVRYLNRLGINADDHLSIIFTSNAF